MILPDPVTVPPVPDRLLFQRLMETLPAHVFFKDLAGRFICINESLARKFGLASAEDAVGRSDYDFFPADLARQKDADERQIVNTGVGIIDLEEKDWTDPTRRQWAATTKLPLRGDDGTIIGTFGISRDITDTKLAHEELEAQHRLLRTLVEILPCRIFVKNQTGQLQLTNEAYRRAITSVADDHVIVGRTLSELIPPERGVQAAIDDHVVLKQGQAIINREQRDATSGNHDRWVLLSKVPLRDGTGEIRGLVGMAADITVQKEAEAQAIRARQKLEDQNRQMEAELAVARDLQRELMQSGLRNVNEVLKRPKGSYPLVSLFYEPSERLAGDFVHAVALSPTRLGILVCDVMGHGVRAALVTALIRGLAGDQRMKDLTPGEILERLNSRLCTLLDQPVMPRFVTALFAAIDLQTGCLSLANAGHPWPLLQRTGGGVEIVQAGLSDPALGLIADATYATTTHSVARGGRLLLLTDGWLEEPNFAGEEFGLARLSERLSSAPPEPAQALQYLADALQRHSTSPRCQDDLCAVMVQI
jgi:sigma-B regulation protein RsbU (phosphoserine phosphatase)